MKTTLQSLQESISQTIKMIDQNQLISDELLQQRSVKYSTNMLDFTNATSLLDKCEQVTTSHKTPKPVIRIIHHFACSGGTLVSKCLSSLPNVFLLSEVHPLSKNHASGKPKYLPSDITTLARYAKIPDIEELAKKLFLSNIIETESFVRERGGMLVLREHTHIDFCLGDKVSPESIVDTYLSNHFDLKHLVTVRNPIDAYMSLVINGWVQFSPPTFDEYCKRLIEFIKRYPPQNIVRYEDIVKQPDKNLQKICKLLDLPYDDRYSDIFDIFTVTGDSGRKGDSIAFRDRRPIDKQLLSDIKGSKNFKIISKILKYEKDL